MKKIFLALLLVAVLFSPVLADRDSSTTTAYTSNTLIQRGDWKVYRVTFVATSAGGSFAIHDALNPGTNSDIKTEGSEATSLNGKTLDFSDKPLEGSTGLYLIVKTATVVVEYE